MLDTSQYSEMKGGIGKTNICVIRLCVWKKKERRKRESPGQTLVISF